MKIYIPQKITVNVKKSAVLPAATLPFARGTSRFALVASAAADRDWNRTAQNFFEILLAIGQSGSAALPLPRVPPFLYIIRFFPCIHFSCVSPDDFFVARQVFCSTAGIGEDGADEGTLRLA